MPKIVHKAVALFLLIATIGMCFSPILGAPISRAQAVDPVSGVSEAGDGSAGSAQGAPVQGTSGSAGTAASAVAGAPAVAAACGLTTATPAEGAAPAVIESNLLASTVAVLVALPPTLSGILGGASAANIQNNYKQSCLNAIAWYLAKILIDGIVRSTVNWINSGFQGGPTFVTNPGQFFTDVAAENVEEFMNALFPGTGIGTILCSPFALDIKIRLILKYSQSGPENKLRCKLVDDIAAGNFMKGDFSAGGWDNWFDITQVPQNNPYGAAFEAEVALDSQIAAAIGIQQQQLAWGNGFHSITAIQDGIKVITTPGKTIENALAEVTTSDIKQLQLADEFNEIVGALMGQMMKTAFSAASGGISGLSKSNSNSSLGGKAYTEALTSSTDNNYTTPSNSATDEFLATSSIPGFSELTANTNFSGFGANMAVGKTSEENHMFTDLEGRRYFARNANDSFNTNMTHLFIPNIGTIVARTTGPNTWWQVDLGTTTTVGQIRIYPYFGNGRGANFPQFTQNYTVLVSTVPFPIDTTDGPVPVETLKALPTTTFWQDIGDETFNNPPLRVGVPNEGAQGRYVRIERNDNLDNSFLELHEVEVYGPQQAQ